MLLLSFILRKLCFYPKPTKERCPIMHFYLAYWPRQKKYVSSRATYNIFYSGVQGNPSFEIHEKRPHINAISLT